MKIRSILAGVDFEKQTDAVLAYSGFFARRFGASVHLLHVIDYLVTPPSYLDRYVDQEKSRAEERLASLSQALSAEGIQVQARVMIGRPQAAFESAILKTGADLVVLGFVAHVLRRSTSEKLIKGLQMPMLVVRGAKAEKSHAMPIALRTILCPVDFSEFSKKALTVAAQLADGFSAELKIVHVLSESVTKKVKSYGESERFLQDWYDREEKRLRDLASNIAPKSTAFMERGDPAERIVARAKEADIDLIVIGARGIGLIAGLFIGSVTDTVIKTAPCPVLVIH